MVIGCLEGVLCLQMSGDLAGWKRASYANMRSPKTTGQVRKSSIALAYSSSYMTITIAEEDGTYSHLDRQHMWRTEEVWSCGREIKVDWHLVPTPQGEPITRVWWENCRHDWVKETMTLTSGTNNYHSPKTDHMVIWINSLETDQYVKVVLREGRRQGRSDSDRWQDWAWFPPKEELAKYTPGSVLGRSAINFYGMYKSIVDWIESKEVNLFWQILPFIQWFK